MSEAVVRRSDPGGWKQERHDLMRAIAGGAIVGMPLLYTMEMWWHGATLSHWHLLGLLAAILVVNVLFNRLSGFRPGSSWGHAVGEAVTALGIGLVFSALVLLLIGELGAGTSPQVALGKILLEAAPVSVGVSFANAQVARGGGDGADDEKPEDPERAQRDADLEDAAATLVGSTVFALNIAPTEEVIRIATRLSPWSLLLVLAASALLCYIILFASGFEKHRVHAPGPLQHPGSETAMNVALSLVVALVLALLLGQRELMASPATAAAATVILGLPAVVGGAAGRVIV